MQDSTRRIGLSLGADLCWPLCYEQIVERLDLALPIDGERVRFEVDRVTIEPFKLARRVRYDVVLDRITHWYNTSREWIKKSILMDDLYVLNNPWSIQSMEKQTTYCAMMRLGMPVPPTWMVPPKAYDPSPDLEPTLRRYARLFDLGAIGEDLGYPLYIKPYDGGAWVGVERIDDEETLRRQYDASDRRLMHLQAAVAPYDLFVRAIGVGPQVRIVRYDPSAPLHDRYTLDADPVSGDEEATLRDMVLTINTFFGWDFNSCESLRRDGELCPIDFANACPDSQVTSLHYHFPWLVTSLVRWSLFCAATRRPMHRCLDWQPYYDIARSDAPYREKLAGYAAVARERLDVERFEAFCDEHLSHLDEVADEFFGSDGGPGCGAAEGRGAVPRARDRRVHRAVLRAHPALARRIRARRRGRVGALKHTESRRSSQLGTEVGVARWGHFGAPVLLFPTAGGDAEEVERFKMLYVLQPLLEAGRVKIYSCDSVAGRAWTSGEGTGRERSATQSALRSLRLPRAGALDPGGLRLPGDRDRPPRGPRSGAFNALAAICRHPDVFRAAICMSGTYDLTRWLDDDWKRGLLLLVPSALRAGPPGRADPRPAAPALRGPRHRRGPVGGAPRVVAGSERSRWRRGSPTGSTPGAPTTITTGRPGAPCCRATSTSSHAPAARARRAVDRARGSVAPGAATRSPAAWRCAPAAAHDSLSAKQSSARSIAQRIAVPSKWSKTMPVPPPVAGLQGSTVSARPPVRRTTGTVP